jgi:hypothetical protein
MVVTWIESMRGSVNEKARRNVFAWSLRDADGFTQIVNPSSRERLNVVSRCFELISGLGELD